MSVRFGRRCALLCVGLWFGLGGAVGWANPALPPLPDIDVPVVTGAQAPHDYAVVIGIESYGSLPPAPFSVRDARAVESFLVSTAGLPADHVAVLIQDEARRPVTARAIQKAVRRAARRVGPEGRVWVYFSGHGARADDPTDRRLLAGDAGPDRADLEPHSVLFSELTSILQSSRAQQSLVIVDAGFNGTNRDGQPLWPESASGSAGQQAPPPRLSAPIEPIPEAPKILRWLATEDNVDPPVFAEAKHGAFTWFAIGALQGWADGVFDEDGIRGGSVDLREAMFYTRTALRAVFSSSFDSSDEDQPDAGLWPPTLGQESGPDLNPLQLFFVVRQHIRSIKSNAHRLDKMCCGTRREDPRGPPVDPEAQHPLPPPVPLNEPEP